LAREAALAPTKAPEMFREALSAVFGKCDFGRTTVKGRVIITQLEAKPGEKPVQFELPLDLS
jgi:hypothetical protein